MKTKLFFVSIFVLFQFGIIYSQIPNSNFEEWILVDSIEQPMGWISNNVRFFISTEKVSSLTQGQYAVKVSSNGPSIEGTSLGVLKTKFKPAQVFDYLTMSYKIDSIEEGKVEVKINKISNNSTTQIGYWVKDTFSNEIELIEIPLAYELLDTLEIIIIAGNTLTGIGSKGYSEIIIDEIGLTNLTAQIELNKEVVSLFPNPTSNSITVKLSTDFYGELWIVDELGRIFQTYKLKGNDSNFNIDISGLKKGLYYLKMFDKRHDIVYKTKSFMVEYK